MACPHILMSESDNVLVLPEGGAFGDSAGDVVLAHDIPPKHKAARRDIPAGKSVVKYGCPIGVASDDIPRGTWVHTHNISLTRNGEKFLPPRVPLSAAEGKSLGVFMGYRRRGGNPGVRNDLWIIPASGCVRGELRHILANYHKPYWIDSVRLLDYQAVCSPGRDTELAADILLGLAANPNAAGILFAGLGCEQMSVSDLYNRAVISGCRAMFAIMRKNSEDTVLRRLDDLASGAPRIREAFPASELCVGIIGGCGSSGFFANPLLGRIAELFISSGGRVLTPFTRGMEETPDIIARMTSKSVYNRILASFREQAPHWDDTGCSRENGVTTADERSLGEISIIGESRIINALRPGEEPRGPAGVQLTRGSPDDAVSCTLLASCSSQIILYATESGTPFGSVVPTVKISTMDGLERSRPWWMDFDASPMLRGESWNDAADRLTARIIRIVNGERAAHEKKGFGDITVPPYL